MMYKKIIILLIGCGILISTKAYAAEHLILTVDNEAHQFIIDHYDDGDFSDISVVEYPDSSKDIQTMRIERDGVYYVLSLVWDQNILKLYVYDVTGKKISSKEVFKANHEKGKDFTLMRLEAVTINGQALIQVRAIKSTYAQPTTLLRKRFEVKPTAEHVLPLANTYSKEIAYPDFTGMDNETAGNALFNYERMAAGVLPVKRSADLDHGCALHNEYMRLNDTLMHGEIEGEPGYTEEGATAGISSDLAALSTTDMSRAIIIWTNGIYHRLPMLSINMKTYGWDVTENTSASGSHYACLNVYGGTDYYNLESDANDTTYYDFDNFEPIPYPGVNQKNVPTTFDTGESPDPIAAFGGSFPVGQPVSLTFSDTDTVTNLAMTLTDEQGKTISGYFRAPHDPSDPNEPYQGNSVTLIPIDPLSAHTTYKVKVTGKRNDANYSKEWQFRTE